MQWPGTGPWNQAGVSIIHFPPAEKILLAAAQCNCKSGFSVRCFHGPRMVPFLRLPRSPKTEAALLLTLACDTFPPRASLVAQTQSGRRLAYPTGAGRKHAFRQLLALIDHVTKCGGLRPAQPRGSPHCRERLRMRRCRVPRGGNNSLFSLNASVRLSPWKRRTFRDRSRWCASS